MSYLDPATLNQLLRYGIALTGNRSDAEDVLHTAIERFLRSKQAAIKEECAYIRKIMRNYWYDEQRKQRSRHNYIEQTISNNTDDHQVIALNDNALEQLLINQQQVAMIWSQLDDEQRELLYFHCVLEYSAQQIADELSCPRGTILSRLSRLKKRIASRITDSEQQQASS